MQRNEIDADLPKEILLIIQEYCTGLTYVRMSEVAFAFYNASKATAAWRKKFMEAGMEPTLFQQIEEIAKEDYSRFYLFFIKVADQKPATLSQLITALTNYYLDFCYKNYQGDKIKSFYNGLRSIENLYDLNAFKPDKEFTFAKQMLDIIAKLTLIDTKEKDKAYANYISRYKTFEGIH